MINQMNFSNGAIVPKVPMGVRTSSNTRLFQGPRFNFYYDMHSIFFGETEALLGLCSWALYIGLGRGYGGHVPQYFTYVSLFRLMV